MGAIANGIGLDGTFLPYCGTFLIFSDYMRPSIRLAALQKTRTLFVFTHDSIFVGEDGPTHQPVEQVDSLRVMPGLTALPSRRRRRDGDGLRVLPRSRCRRGPRPVLLSLTRQGLPALERPAASTRCRSGTGAYVVSEVPTARPTSSCSRPAPRSPSRSMPRRSLSADGTPGAGRLDALASSSSSSRAEAEQDASSPTTERRSSRSRPDRGETLRRFVGRRGLVIGMEGFGASAPYHGPGRAFRLHARERWRSASRRRSSVGFAVTGSARRASPTRPLPGAFRVALKR